MSICRVVNIFHVYRVHCWPSSKGVRFGKRKKYHAKDPASGRNGLSLPVPILAVLRLVSWPTRGPESYRAPVDEHGPGECVACLAQAMNAFTLFW
jgi:hypothetical protein